MCIRSSRSVIYAVWYSLISLQFLYFLFDRHWASPDENWRGVVDDYVSVFSISRHFMLESLVFYLLDDSSDHALEVNF